MDPDTTSDRTHTHCSFLVDRPSDDKGDLIEQLLLSNLLNFFVIVSSFLFLSAASANAADLRIDACTHSFIF